MIHAKRKAGHAILHFVQTTQRPISTSALKIKANRGRLLEAEVSSCETGEKISPSGRGRICTPRRSFALRAGEALRNPVGGLDARRRIHALGRKALDVDQPHHLGVRVPI
jgi:hypothetical protein